MLLRLSGFVLNAGLIFVLVLQQPRLHWPYPGQIPAWENMRIEILKGLRRVQGELDRSRQEKHPAASWRKVGR